MASIEILRARPSKFNHVLDAFAAAARSSGDQVIQTSSYQGKSDWLVLWGVGAEVNNRARLHQLKKGVRTLHWDLGYFGRPSYFRMCIDEDHPDQWIAKTEPIEDRWDQQSIDLTDEYQPDGHILLVGLGKKSRKYLKLPNWEREKFKQLKERFKGKKIVFRPKGDDLVSLPCQIEKHGPIGNLLKGCSLVVCRHSNVAIDGMIRNIPFETEAGAAKSLTSLDQREDFLRRLSWWQWRIDEMGEALAFAKRISA